MTLGGSYEFHPQVPSPRVLCFLTGVRISAEQPFFTKIPRQENVHTSDPDADKAPSILLYCTLGLIR